MEKVSRILSLCVVLDSTKQVVVNSDRVRNLRRVLSWCCAEESEQGYSRFGCKIYQVLESSFEAGNKAMNNEGEGEGSESGDEGVGDDEGSSGDGVSDGVVGEGNALGFGDGAADGLNRVSDPGDKAEGTSRALFDSFHEEAVRAKSDKGIVIRSPGDFKRPSSPAGSWCSRFGITSLKVKADYGIKADSITSVFLGNTPPSMSHYKIRSWFSYFGSVVDVYVSKRRGKIDGSFFAFVRFRFRADAIAACTEVDGSKVEGFQVVANLARFVRPRPSANSDPIGVVDGKVFGHNIMSDTLPQAGISGKCSYAQMLEFGGKSSGVCPGTRIILPEVGLKVYEEDADHVADVFCNKSIFNSKILVSKQVQFDEVNWGFSDHQSESCSGKCSLFEPLYYIVCLPTPLDRLSVQVLSEDEIRGGPLPKLCVLSIVCEVPAANPIDDGLCTHSSGCGFEDGRVSDFRIVDGYSLGLSSQSSIIADRDASQSLIIAVGDAKQVNSQLEVSYGKENEVQVSDISSTGGMDYVDDDSGNFLKVAGPMSKEEKLEFSDHVRLFVHDALQMGKEMGINFSPRDERMIKIFSVLRQLDREKLRMGFDDEPVHS